MLPEVYREWALGGLRDRRPVVGVVDHCGHEIEMVKRSGGDVQAMLDSGNQTISNLQMSKTRCDT